MRPSIEAVRKAGVRRVVVLTAVVGMIVVAAGLGMYFIYMIQGNTTVEESVTAQNITTVNWNGTLYPGETTSQSFNFSNAAGSPYEVRVSLENFSDVRESGLTQARVTTEDAYISNFGMGAEGGTEYSFKDDLLNDGNASFHVLNASSTIEGQLNVTLKESSAVGDTMNFSVAFARAGESSYGGTVALHNNSGVLTGSCNQVSCHNISDGGSGPAHLELVDSDESCSDCHGRSMMDMHQNCDACHGPYPVKEGTTMEHGFGGSGKMGLPPTESCSGSGCHNATNGYAAGEYIAHNTSLDTGYCNNCHNSDNWNASTISVSTMHNDTKITSKQCSDCHGIPGDQIHDSINAWEVNRCGDCHNGF